MARQGLAQLGGRRGVPHQGHISVDPLPLDRVRVAHHGGFRHRLVQHQGAFDFRRAETVARHIQHIVNAAGDPIVAILVPAGAVASEVLAGEGLEIGVYETLMVAVEGAHLAGPGALQAQRPRRRPLQLPALVIHDARLHAEKGQGGGARLQGCGPRQGRDQDAAGLRLPPGVDDGATPLAHHMIIPLPGLRVDGFADRA